MGLFSFIGKVAKTGLSLATGGKSDAVLKALGKVTGLGGKPKPVAAVAQGATPTIQERAIVNKALPPYTPRVQRTESVEGWSFGKGISGGFKRKSKRTKRSHAQIMRAEGISQGYLTKSGKPRRKPAKARSPRASTGRKAPAGGLDLKAISVLWNQQGKPGKWADFIKANSHIRKS